MSTFRKRPIEVQAYRTLRTQTIETLEGKMKARVGDWIITGVAGETYPCKNDIFRRTYEPADADAVSQWDEVLETETADDG